MQWSKQGSHASNHESSLGRGGRRWLVRLADVAVVAALLAMAGCGSESDASATEARPVTPAAGPDRAPATPVQELAGVDISELDGAARRVWWSQVSDLTSPCGEPVSVAECITTNVACRSCVPAARYLARLAAGGLERDELREHFRVRYGADTRVEIDLDDAPVRGAVMAPVTIVEFSDFECPFCSRAHRPLGRAVEEFPGQVRLVFRHYPLSMHQHAAAAAVAAEAAGAQGKFWEMHDLLFENQTNLEPTDIARYAQSLGLDMDRFRADFEDEALRARVDRSRAEGQRIGVNSTPTIYVNNRELPPAQLDELIDYLREEIAAR
ncbi:MAG: thioredoxin domain-containing protein [Polyangiales bacterium]|nr:thioredoxin domain-containing protein [Myxococcales bacterium]MCB9661756.1 thioredoxin domain-containing protein [Sandaracinaceae bacterium]